MITRRLTLTRPTSLFRAAASWTCPSCTQAQIHSRATRMPQPHQQRRQQQSRLLSTSPVRSMVSVPELAFRERFLEVGVPGLLSAKGYDLAWEQYQSHLMHKLNEHLAGKPYEHMSVKELVMIFARDPTNAALFNHASMAWNNHFFFNTLSTKPVPINNTPQLQRLLIKDFGSIETLRATMLDTADAMFGPGFVWLVYMRDYSGTTRQGKWKILSTYNAGTPFPEAGYRQQGIDMNNSNPNAYDAYLRQQANIPGNSAGSFGSQSVEARSKAKFPPGGTSLQPVLCVNTWEYVWLEDFRPAGKRAYLHDWWNAVDWGIVQNQLPPDARNEIDWASPTSRH